MAKRKPTPEPIELDVLDFPKAAEGDLMAGLDWAARTANTLAWFVESGDELPAEARSAATIAALDLERVLFALADDPRACFKSADGEGRDPRIWWHLANLYLRGRVMGARDGFAQELAPLVDAIRARLDERVQAPS